MCGGKVGDLDISWKVHSWDFLAACVRDIQNSHQLKLYFSKVG